MKQLTFDVPTDDRRHEEHISQDTSVEAYIDMKLSGELMTRCEQVVHALELYGDHTAKELIVLAHLPERTTSARINELVFGTKEEQKAGNFKPIIEEKGKRLDQYTQRKAIVWGLVPQPKYYAQKDLLERGWTLELIEQLIGAPDETENNPHADFGAPMKLFLGKRVRKLEKSKEFKRGKR